MSLRDTFIDALKDLASAEKQLVRALPKMAKAAVSSELQQAFTDHLAETKIHVERIEQAFESIDEKPKTTLCKAMEGLVAEGAEHIEKDAGDVYGDIALTGAAQRVEHYEIAAYSSTIALGEALGYDDAVALLNETLEEEQAASELLTELSQPMIAEALAEDDDEGESDDEESEDEEEE
jgi:ferritin-like metal-binding protein YciE